MEVICRLFNHKPAIQGELAFFINEFEKKLAKESAIFDDTENLSKNLSDDLFPSCKSMIEDDLSQLKSKVDDCWKLSQRVLELDQSVLGNINANLEDEDEFLESISKQKQAILSSFDESLVNLNKDYQEMKKQLERENFPSK